MLPTIDQFWIDLTAAYGGEDIRKMFTVPEQSQSDKNIYSIYTLEDYIFDDSFWDVFHEYPFHICHISWRKYELCFKIITESEEK